MSEHNGSTPPKDSASDADHNSAFSGIDNVPAHPESQPVLQPPSIVVEQEPESQEPIQTSESRENQENEIPDQTEERSNINTNNENSNINSTTNSNSNVPEDSIDNDDPNTSLIFPHPLSGQFATPLKSLPPLKDIEPIATPKTFMVAKDVGVNSSPVMTKDSILGDTDLVETFLGYVPVRIDETLLETIRRKAYEFQDLVSENSFLKLNQEQANNVQHKKLVLLNKKVEKLNETNSQLASENESLKESSNTYTSKIGQLQSEVTSLTSKLDQAEQSKNEFDVSYNTAVASRDQEIRKLNETNHRLTQSNIDNSQKLNQFSNQLNEANEEKFNYKLELTKATNELTYVKNQKDWYEKELKSIQERFTDLIKRQESEYMTSSNKISSLSSSKASLERMLKAKDEQINEIQAKVETLMLNKSSLASTIEVEKVKYLKELSSKDELIKVTQIQSNERLERVNQLETYTEELKQSLGESVQKLEKEVFEKTERVVYLEEKLARTEEVLDAELHKETALPKLTNSAEMVVASDRGISLSALYSEFNHIKKQLVLERSQKEKLLDQLQMFVAELESKKPAIANYREQIQFYESSLKEMLGKIETVRFEKAEGIKEANRLKARLGEYEKEIVQVKQLAKDLGKQLCYYLIYSKVRDSNEDPLSGAERKAIDKILAKSGNSGAEESDTDKLISERLLGFASVIEMQQKNQELTSVIRELSRQLELKEQEAKGFEAAAIEEAKDAILTLQSELDSVHLKYDALERERDLLKGITNKSENTPVKMIANNDYRKRLDESDDALKALQKQSSNTISELTAKLSTLGDEKNSLVLQVSTLKHDSEMSQTRYETTKQALTAVTKEADHLRNDISFWKNQVSKQELLLVSKSNELHTAESKLASLKLDVSNLTTQVEISSSSQKALTEEINQLRSDKVLLNEYLRNLQAIVSEKDAVHQEVRQRSQELEQQYKELKQAVSEKEERIKILSNQSDLALSAQNAKLEQFNELSRQLLESKYQLAEKQREVELLKEKVTTTSYRPIPEDSSLDSSERSRFTMEYQHLKKELQLAHEQVAEFTRIAHAAESALANASDSFETYKKDVEAKTNLLVNEKELLETEIKKVNEQVGELRRKLSDSETNHAQQSQALQAQLHEFRSKASSYDELKADFEQRLTTVNEELQSQVQVSNSIQQKYQDKLEENEQLTKQFFDMKARVEAVNAEIADAKKSLEAAKTELAGKDGAVAAEKEILQEQLQLSKAKVQEVTDQYQILLNQLELKHQEHDDTDLKLVVTYLRREKESSESRAAVAVDEKNHLEKRLNSVVIELEAAKSQLSKLQSTSIALDEANVEHDRILEQLQQLNILRESNTTLRNENAKFLQEIKELQKQISEVSRPETVAASNDTDFKDQQVRLLTEENERLKTQLGNNEELSAMMQRFENLKTEFKSKLTAHRNKNRELEKQLEESKTVPSEKIDQLTKEKQALELQLTKEKQALEQEKQSLEQRLTKLQEALSKAESKTGDEEKLKAQFEAEKSNLKTQMESEFNAKLKEVQSPEKNNYEDEYKAKVAELEKSVQDRKEALEKEMAASLQEAEKKLQTQLESSTDLKNYEDQIAALKKEFEDKLTKEKQTIEKKHEFKLRVLTRKIEKLEKAKEETQPEKPLGHQFTESTLSVHRPSIDRPKKGDDKEKGNGKKRPFVNKPQGANKKPNSG